MLIKNKELIIRSETPNDYYETELATKKAFWNLHSPGCNEHYLVHLLREDSNYVPELTRVAVIDNKIVGTILYAKAYVQKGDIKTEVLIFGPLCVIPEFQNCGIGRELLSQTLTVAKEMNFGGIIIFGEPNYYPKFGFLTCDNFGITTSDNKNFDAFMGINLCQGFLESLSGGKFYVPKVYENLPTEKVDEYDKKFPHMEKLKLLGQWN